MIQSLTTAHKTFEKFAPLTIQSIQDVSDFLEHLRTIRGYSASSGVCYSDWRSSRCSKLDLFQAALGSQSASTGAITMILLDLSSVSGSNPTHELIQALQQYKNRD